MTQDRQDPHKNTGMDFTDEGDSGNGTPEAGGTAHRISIDRDDQIDISQLTQKDIETIKRLNKALERAEADKLRWGSPETDSEKGEKQLIEDEKDSGKKPISLIGYLNYLNSKFNETKEPHYRIKLVLLIFLFNSIFVIVGIKVLNFILFR